MKHKIIMMVFGMILMAIMVTGAELIYTKYIDIRQQEELNSYCISNGYTGWDDINCNVQYDKEKIDDDRNTKVIDNINQLSDFCYDPAKHELCRIFQDNMLQIFQTTSGGTIWLECQDGEPDEWTRTHCPYGLSESNTRCQQSGATDTIYLDCSISWEILGEEELPITTGGSSETIYSYGCVSRLDNPSTCDGGLSNGIGTRCYTNNMKLTWKYCKEGWEIV